MRSVLLLVGAVLAHASTATANNPPGCAGLRLTSLRVTSPANLSSTPRAFTISFAANFHVPAGQSSNDNEARVARCFDGARACLRLARREGGGGPGGRARGPRYV